MYCDDYTAADDLHLPWPFENHFENNFENRLEKGPSTPSLIALLDAFELDDVIDPMPEYGDFWPETTR